MCNDHNYLTTIGHDDEGQGGRLMSCLEEGLLVSMIGPGQRTRGEKVCDSSVSNPGPKFYVVHRPENTMVNLNSSLLSRGVSAPPAPAPGHGCSCCSEAQDRLSQCAQETSELGVSMRGRKHRQGAGKLQGREEGREAREGGRERPWRRSGEQGKGRDWALGGERKKGGQRGREGRQADRLTGTGRE
eukprot:696693-Rhodomonas_salina.1